MTVVYILRSMADNDPKLITDLRNRIYNQLKSFS